MLVRVKEALQTPNIAGAPSPGRVLDFSQKKTADEHK